MKSRFRLLVLLVAFGLLASLVGYWTLPRLVAALPGQARARLPHQLLQLATTPLPTALPAPLGPLTEIIITIPSLDQADMGGDPTPDPASTPGSLGRNALAGDMEAPVSPASTEVASASPGQTPTPTPAMTFTATPVPLPRSFLVEGVPIVPQKFNNCGPANLSISLAFYGHQTHQLDIAAVVKPDYDDKNVGPEELVQYVVDHTALGATLHRGGDLETLKRFLASGFPIVVEKGLTPSEHEGWMGHYLTLAGYDDVAGQFLSIDTLLGPWDASGLPITYEELERKWANFNYTFYVVYPRERESTVFEILGPDLRDPPTMWRQAALAAQSEIEENPENAFAWFNLGASMTHLGQLMGQSALFHTAAAAFDRARQIGLPPRMLWYQFEPYVAYLEAGRVEDVMMLTGVTMAGGGQDVEETHLYRGHALLVSGDVGGARAAYRQAMEINPSFLQAREALDSMEEDAGGS